MSIERAHDTAGLLRRLKVVVDDRPPVRLWPGRTASVALPPGPHRAYAKMDWARSPTVHFHLPEEGRVRLVGRVSFARVFLAFVRPHRALELVVA